MAEDKDIQEELIISDLETLKAVSDPLRMQIMQFIGMGSASGSPTTVKELADHLRLPPTKLYYHVNLLEKYGLIRIAETRLVSGIVEKHYTTSAKRFRVALSAEDESQMTDDILRGALPSTISSFFNNAKANFEESLRYRLQQKETKQDETQTDGLLQQSMLRLSHSQALEFIGRFETLFRDFKAHETPEGQIFGLTIAFGPYYHLNSKDGEAKS